MPNPKRIFNDPEELKEAWLKFKENAKEQANEWIETQYVGKDGDIRLTPKKIPLTFEGFKRFARDRYGCIEQYFTNQDDFYSDYIGICRAIKEEIRENQVIGGMLGFFNPSITQRLNSLVDKQQTEVKGGLNIPNLPDIADRK
jgi:hypothetical protein